MALPDILGKIKEDAEKEAASIAKEGESEAEKIREATDRIKQETKDDFERETHKRLAQKERSFMGIKKQELNVLMEAEKRRLVDEAFEEAGVALYPEQKQKLEVEVAKILFGSDTE